MLRISGVALLQADTSLIQMLTPILDLNSWLDLGSASWPQTSLAIWTSGRAWLPSAALLCSPASGTVQNGPFSGQVIASACLVTVLSSCLPSSSSSPLLLLLDTRYRAEDTGVTKRSDAQAWCAGTYWSLLQPQVHQQTLSWASDKG